jgi:hypothetical protein
MNDSLSLFGGRFDPMTHELYLVEGDVRRTVGAYRAWQKACGRRTAVKRRRGPLPGLLESLETGRLQLIFVEASGWTAVFGAESRSAVGNLSQRLECQGLIVTYAAHTIDLPDGYYGAQVFMLHDGQTGPIGLRRFVEAVNDGRWCWAEHGDPLPFEKPEYYTRRRIKDRLPPELLVEYCAALGVRPWDEDFYGDEAVLVEVWSR